MPTIFFYGPKMEEEKKRELVRSFTSKASELTGIDESAFVVYLRTGEPNSVGVGGELLSRRKKGEGGGPSERPEGTAEGRA